MRWASTRAPDCSSAPCSARARSSSIGENARQTTGVKGEGAAAAEGSAKGVRDTGSSPDGAPDAPDEPCAGASGAEDVDACGGDAASAGVGAGATDAPGPSGDRTGGAPAASPGGADTAADGLASPAGAGRRRQSTRADGSHVESSY